MENKSRFEGGILGYIGINILTFVIILFTLGIALPWALCIKYGWVIKNTVIDDRKLTFDGTGAGLFGNWILWWIFSVITFGIYTLWIPIKLEQWKVKHTHFIN